jgi:hypothetical protein
LSLRILNKFKLKKFPADKVVINIHNSSQHIAKFRAGTNIPAKTGKDNNNNTAVITTAHPNKANLCNLIPGVLIFIIVVMTLEIIYFYSGLYIQRILKYGV